MTVQCTESVHPGDDELLAWSDGEATQAVRAHLDQCAVCRRRALAYAHEGAVLSARLHRVDCPDPLLLGEYALDLLSDAERTRVAGHVLSCLSCAEELALLRADMRAPEPAVAASPAQAWRAVPRLIARLWSPTPDALAGAPLAVRGQAQLSTATYTADALQISLAVQPDGPASWMVLGLVVFDQQPEDAESAGDAAGGFPVTVYDQDRLRAEVAVDELGNFACPALPAGTYELALHLPDRVVIIPWLEVGPA